MFGAYYPYEKNTLRWIFSQIKLIADKLSSVMESGRLTYLLLHSRVIHNILKRIYFTVHLIATDMMKY